MKARALVVDAKDAPFRMEEIELEEPGRGEVLIRIAASGVCHTDAITRAGDMPMPFPCVLGHEGLGLAAIMAARNSGVTRIIAADVHDSRLAMARDFGATHTINSRTAKLVEEVAKITGGTVDFAFDCTGVIAVIETIAQTVGMLGTLVLIGGARPKRSEYTTAKIPPAGKGPRGMGGTPEGSSLEWRALRSFEQRSLPHRSPKKRSVTS
jgi:aryl-alcohol dehydrogenase